MLLADDSYWDQNAFNDLVRRGMDTAKREDRLFRWAVDFLDRHHMPACGSNWQMPVERGVCARPKHMYAPHVASAPGQLWALSACARGSMALLLPKLHKGPFTSKADLLSLDSPRTSPEGPPSLPGQAVALGQC